SAVPGQEFAVRVHVNNPGAAALPLNRVWLETPTAESWNVMPESSVPAAAPAREAIDARFNVRVAENAAPTRPYFSRPNDEQPYYDLLDPRYRNLSFAPYPLAVNATVSYRGVPLHLAEV